MIYRVADFGAKADDATNDAPAIQAAINACARAGGGCEKLTIRAR